MSDHDFSGLRAHVHQLHAEAIARRSATPRVWWTSAPASWASRGSSVEVLRAVDHDIATGVYPDMTEHGWATDEWPEI